MRWLLVLLGTGVLASSLIEADTVNDDSTLSQAVTGFGPLHVKMGSQHPEEQMRDRDARSFPTVKSPLQPTVNHVSLQSSKFSGTLAS